MFSALQINRNKNKKDFNFSTKSDKNENKIWFFVLAPVSHMRNLNAIIQSVFYIKAWYKAVKN